MIGGDSQGVMTLPTVVTLTGIVAGAHRYTLTAIHYSLVRPGAFDLRRRWMVPVPPFSARRPTGRSMMRTS